MLEPLQKEHLTVLVKRAMKTLPQNAIEDDAITLLAELAAGDARVAARVVGAAR